MSFVLILLVQELFLSLFYVSDLMHSLFAASISRLFNKNLLIQSNQSSAAFIYLFYFNNKSSFSFCNNIRLVCGHHLHQVISSVTYQFQGLTPSLMHSHCVKRFTEREVELLQAEMCHAQIKGQKRSWLESCLKVAMDVVDFKN